MKKRISMAKFTPNKTVKDGYKEFITSCKVKNLSEQTIFYYDKNMKIFETFLEMQEISLIKEIDLSVVNEFILYLKALGSMNDISINTVIRAIRAILYYFQKLGYCNPFKIGLIKADKTIKETYTDHELKLLLVKPTMEQFAEYRDWVTINFLLATGVRVGELVGIQVKDVDFEDSVVKVKRGKSRRERHIPLSKTITKILMEYISVRQCSSEDDYLFCNTFGQKLTEDLCKHSVLRYNRARGVNKTSLHLFRHTFAKMFILNGGDVFRLQKILGHKSIDIVKPSNNAW